MADKIVAEYTVKVDEAVKNLNRLEKEVKDVENASIRAGKASSDGFLKGSEGAKRLNAELLKQPKTLAELELKLRNLKELLRDDAQIGTKGFKAVTAEIKKTEKAISSANGKIESLNKTSKSLISQFSKVGAALGLAFSAHQVVQLGREMVTLAAEGEGVRNAFEKLDDPTLLNDLRRATRGTLSELELMAKATFARQMGIELEKLPKLLEFARRVAKDTGKDFEFLSEQIVVGIGRKSTQRLDDFGITSDRVKAKLHGLSMEAATTGQVASAVLEIATEEMARMGDETVTSGDMLKQYRADWLDLKEAIGIDILSQFKELNDDITETGNLLNVDLGGSDILKFFASNVVKALLEPFTLLNWAIQKNIEAFDWLKSLFTDGDLEQGSKQLTDIQKGFAAIRKELDKYKEESDGDANSVNKQIRNVFLLENAIRTLKEERAKEGTERKRIFEINKLLIPLEQELSTLLGKETEAQKALREQLELNAKLRAQVFTGAEIASGIPVVVAMSSTLKGLNDLLKEQNKILENAPEFSEQYKEASKAINQLKKDIDSFNDDYIDPSEGFQGITASGIINTKSDQDTFSESLNQWNEYANSVAAIGNSISQIQAAFNQQEIDALNYQLQQGEITRDEYDNRRKEIMEQQAEDRKAAAIFDATVSGFSAIVQAYNTDPTGILAGITAAVVAAQIAAISATPVPQYAEGGWVDSKGKIHGRKHAQGGVKIEAEGDEFIVKGTMAKKNASLLEALNKGTGQDWINKNMVYPAIQNVIENGALESNSGNWGNITASLKDHNIIHSQDRMRQEFRHGFMYLAGEQKKLFKKQSRGGYRA